jgi:hypothetical protein
MGQIGEPKREIYVEPLELPVPSRAVPESTPAPAPREIETPQPVGVPA